MSDNPRPVLYGSATRPSCRGKPSRHGPGAVTVVGKHCESGDVIVRDACVPEDLDGRRRAGHPGHRRLRPLDGVQLQQGAPPAGRVRR